MRQKEKTALTKMQKEYRRKSGLTDRELYFLGATKFPKKELKEFRKKHGGRVK